MSYDGYMFIFCLNNNRIVGMIKLLENRIIQFKSKN